MSDTAAEPSAPHEVVRPRDRMLLPYAGTRRSPVWIGLAIALGFLILSVGLDEIMTFLGYGPLRFSSAEVRIGSFLITGLLLGYIPTANALLHRGVKRDLLELRPALRQSNDEFQKLLGETTAVPRAALLLATGIGLGVGSWLGGALVDRLLDVLL